MILPDVLNFSHTEIYRDGGSIGIFFFNDNLNRNEYELFLKIDRNADLKNKIYIFENASLKHGYNCIYKCPMTGQEIPDFKIECMPINWEDTLSIFMKIDQLNKTTTKTDANRLKIVREFLEKAPNKSMHRSRPQ